MHRNRRRIKCPKWVSMRDSGFPFRFDVGGVLAPRQPGLRDSLASICSRGETHEHDRYAALPAPHLPSYFGLPDI
jgi:hypothetical protein